VNALAIFSTTNGVVMPDSLTGANPPLHVAFFRMAVVGNNLVDGSPYRFVRAVAKHLFGRVVPGVDGSREVVTVDGDVRGPDDCGEIPCFVELVFGHGSVESWAD
jgi:hypothetical protein